MLRQAMTSSQLPCEIMPVLIVRICICYTLRWEN